MHTCIYICISLQAFLYAVVVKQLNNNIVYNKNDSYKVKCWQLAEVELY